MRRRGSKITGMERVEPTPLEAIALLDLNNNILDLRDMLDITVARGIYDDNTYTVDSNGLTIDYLKAYKRPVFAADIFNDGPSGLYIGVNKTASTLKAPLYSGEEVHLDYRAAKLRFINLKVASGIPNPQSTVRIYVIG